MSAAGISAELRGPPPGREAEEHGSYYGQPVIKEPVWTFEIPTYFFVGGLAGRVGGARLAGAAARPRGSPAARWLIVARRRSPPARRC